MKEVDKKFKQAYKITSSMTEKLPPDVMLKLYAYYKQATKGINYTRLAGQNEVRNAFKANALFQLKNMTEKEAKIAYITLVEEIIQQKLN
jgi:diazepam-binding inhibitor (GABA receptor modulating acyl-CoA-binding protein)